MRSAPDLIAELEEEQKNHLIVTMAIDFETSITFIRAKDENRLAMLNSAIQAGGTPVGLIAADRLSGCEIAMSMRVYPEHLELSKEFDAEAYVFALIDKISWPRGGCYRSPDASNSSSPGTAKITLGSLRPTDHELGGGKSRTKGGRSTQGESQ